MQFLEVIAIVLLIVAAPVTMIGLLFAAVWTWCEYRPLRPRLTGAPSRRERYRVREVQNVDGMGEPIEGRRFTAQVRGVNALGILWFWQTVPGTGWYETVEDAFKAIREFQAKPPKPLKTYTWDGCGDPVRTERNAV